MEPYRLPYEDETFDVVISTQVLEHAQNKDTCLREIRRVLKPGGWSMHQLPSKWFLPTEPHIFVPLVNYLWPNVPSSWLSLWALLGVRNSFQRGKGWREVADLNQEFCRTGLAYSSRRDLRRVSEAVFGNFEVATDFYIDHAGGGAAAVARKIPLRRLMRWWVSTFRQLFIVSQKRSGD